MTDNSFGKLFSFTSFGESHGTSIGCVVDGVPPKLLLNEGLIQPYLDRRRPGTSKFVTQRREDDEVEGGVHDLHGVHGVCCLPCGFLAQHLLPTRLPPILRPMEARQKQD